MKIYKLFLLAGFLVLFSALAFAKDYYSVEVKLPKEVYSAGEIIYANFVTGIVRSTPTPDLVNLEYYFYDAQRNTLESQTLSLNTQLLTDFLDDQNSFVAGFNTDGLSQGTYIVSATVTSYYFTESIVLNNRSEKAITILSQSQEPLAIPETNQIIVLLAALSVLFLVKTTSPDRNK